VTIDQEIQLPNAVLQPGTHVFKLLDSQSDRHIVQVYNKDENHIITTMLAIPNYRLKQKGKAVISFWEVPAGQIPAARAWFYPGALFGEEFAYPKTPALEVATYAKTAVPTSNEQSAEETSSASITAMNQNGDTSELDKNTYTAKAEPVAASVPMPHVSPQSVPQAVEPTPVPTPRSATAPGLPQELPLTAKCLLWDSLECSLLWRSLRYSAPANFHGLTDNCGLWSGYQQ
jgi:hypothetical protein